MEVKRIVPNVAAERVEEGLRFYRDVLGLDTVMDLGWIVTLSSAVDANVQVNMVDQGGSGTEVPDISIEVDDVDEAYRRTRVGGFQIVYPLTDEPWGVRRFYTRDLCGKLINVMAHSRSCG